MSWAANVANNIFPLSEEQGDIGIAMEEWQYQGNTYDLEIPHEICQLCDHPEIRYQFEIVNKHNGHALLVGSECINKFDGIAVLDEAGNALPTEEAKQKVNRDKRRLITDARTKGLLNSLVELARKETDFDIASFEKDYKERGAFTPKQLSTLIWRFEKHGVPFNKSYFNIYIRRNKDKEALLAMPDWQVRRMWPCLSASQKAFVQRHRTRRA